MDIKQEAKELVNKVYQPTGYIRPNESPNTLWNWSKDIAKDFVEHFIEKMPEGSANWLHHRKLIEEIEKQ